MNLIICSCEKPKVDKYGQCEICTRRVIPKTPNKFTEADISHYYRDLNYMAPDLEVIVRSINACVDCIQYLMIKRSKEG